MRLQNPLLILLLNTVLIVRPALAQPGLPELEPVPPTEPLPDAGPTPLPESPLPGSPSPQAVALTEADVVALLLQNNLELRNAALERIAQQQELQEAESRFLPDFIPTISVGINARENEPTDTTRDARLRAELLTPLGTDIELSVDVDDRELDLSLTQPLLRGAGRAVNTSQVEIARLQEENNQLDLRQRLITDITSGVLTYHALIRAQASLQIQQLSLETQQQQRRSIAALVEAGRRAQFELVEIDANLAATETSVLEAENDLEQAKSDLIDLLDIEDSLEITIPEETLATLNTIAREFVMPSLEQLVAVAYSNRPDYQQLQFNLQIAELDERVAIDNRRWNLDLRANASTGDFSEASTELVLTHLLEDESTETAFQRNQVTQQQLKNDLDRLNSDIRLDVADQLRNVESARNRIESTRLARELAEKRLENALARARLGRSRDIFEALELQNDVVAAQNNEVNAAIDVADAIATLNQSLGTTLTVWAEQVEASQLLITPALSEP